MSDQFNRYNKRLGIIGRIVKLKDQLEDYKREVDELQTECERLEQDRTAAIERAEAAEKKLNDPDYRYAGKGPIHRDAILIRNKHIDEARQERDAAIQRAEKAEAELAKQKERSKAGRLHKMKKITKLRDALKLYGDPDNWRFTHDKENNLLWVTSLGPDYAMEILNRTGQESSEERETANALL